MSHTQSTVKTIITQSPLMWHQYKCQAPWWLAFACEECYTKPVCQPEVGIWLTVLVHLFIEKVKSCQGNDTKSLK